MNPYFFKFLLFIILYNCSIPFGQTQNIIEKYVQQGLDNNIQVIKDQISLDQQQNAIAVAKSNFLPTVSFKADYLLAAGGRDIFIPIGDLMNPVYQTLNTITGESQFPTNLQNVEEQFLPNNFHDTRVEFYQPIFNTSIYYNQLAQERLISVQEAKMESYKTVLQQQIKSTYYTYLKTEKVLEIYNNNQKLLTTLMRTNQKLVKNDKATDEIIYSVQYELDQLESDRMQTIQQRKQLQTYFNSLLNRDLEDTIIIDTAITFEPFNIIQKENLMAAALNNRSELQQLSAGIEANQIAEELQRKMYLPTVGLKAQAGFQGFGYNFNDQGYATLGIGLNWNIYEGKRKTYAIEKAQLETLQLQQDYASLQQQIQLQVSNAWYQLEAAKQQLQSNKAAVNSAQKSYNIFEKKYRNDQAILIEYLDAQTKLITAQIAVAISQYDVLIRQVELEGALAL